VATQDRLMGNQPFHSTAQLLLIALPWLNPIVFGPSPGLISFLVSWCALGALVLLSSGPVAAPCFRGWLIASVLSSIFGLFQYFGIAPHLSPLINQTGAGEAFANLRQRNQFASLTSIGVLAMLWFAVAGRDGLGRRKRWIFLALAVLLAAGNAASASRTGLVQLGLLVGMAWVWGWLRQPGPLRVIVLIVPASYLIASSVLPLLAGLDPATTGMLGRLQEGAPTCASRWVLWDNVLYLIAQRPWWGWGWGELDYAHYVTLYPRMRFCDILDNGHNLPLHLAVELGIPFALVFCGAASWIVWRAKPWRETEATRQMAWGVLAIILLHSMLEYPLWYGPFQMALVLCLWLLWPMHSKPGTASIEGSRTVRAIRIAVAAVILPAIAYSSWDYHRVSQIYLVPQARDAAYREDTLSKISGSWLFQSHVRFAELTTTSLMHANAQWTLDTATALLHYSPEPRVVEKVIESAVMLGRDDEALFHLIRYRAAFPREHAIWRSAQGLPPPVD
jgi:O-antigen ligase